MVLRPIKTYWNKYVEYQVDKFEDNRSFIVNICLGKSDTFLPHFIYTAVCMCMLVQLLICRYWRPLSLIKPHPIFRIYIITDYK